MSRYEELLSQIDQMKAEAEKIRREELSSVIAQIKESMAKHGITLEDLGGRSRRTRGERKSAVAPKYRDPESGATWSGRGRTPRWLAAHLESGRKIEEFAIA